MRTMIYFTRQAFHIIKNTHYTSMPNSIPKPKNTYYLHLMNLEIVIHDVQTIDQNHTHPCVSSLTVNATK
jgi:hypothetical protein